MSLTLFQKLREVCLVFFKLGVIGFGGPAAHTALMHDEVVKRRKWLSNKKFLELMGITQLIPGPNSTELALHIGYLRAGWPGLFAAGLCFILPAALIVSFLAYLYVRYGSLPQVQNLSHGIKPIMIAIILQALWDLGQKNIKNRFTLIFVLGIFSIYFLGINEVLLLLLSGLVFAALKNKKTFKKIFSFFPVIGLPFLSSAVSFNTSTLFLTFLKIGSILYGSGYVLLAYLHSDFVMRLGWLNDQQLLDAIAVGQITPGPLFTTATFIGYVLGGAGGAFWATLGIFLPAFIFVILSIPLLVKLKKSKWISAFLNGVTLASLALMAAVSIRLVSIAVIDLFSLIIMLLALLMLTKWKTNTFWLVILGAAAGLLIKM